MGPGGRRRRRGGSPGTSPAGAPAAGRGRGVHPPAPLPVNTSWISSSFHSAKYSYFESVWFTCKNLYTLQFLLFNLQFLLCLKFIQCCGSRIFFSDPDPIFSNWFRIRILHNVLDINLPLYSCLVSVLGCSL